MLFCIFQNFPLFLIPKLLPLFQTLFPLFALENIPLTCFNSLFGQFLRLHKESLLVFRGNPHQLQRILDEIFLDHVIQRRPSLKRRRVINLDHNGLKIIHNHNIKPQNMEAHVPLILLRLTILILMPYRWQTTYHRLYDTLLNL